VYQVGEQGAAIPALERWPAKIHVVDPIRSLTTLVPDLREMNSWFAIVERSVNEIDAQNPRWLLVGEDWKDPAD